MSEKTEGTHKNGQSKDTGNSGNTRHRTKTNKTQTDEQHQPHQKTAGELRFFANKCSSFTFCLKRLVSSKSSLGWEVQEVISKGI
jgi:hypothetical protein